MASWKDGAEYAPIERPDGFATPRAKPLANPPKTIDLAAGAPKQAPGDFLAPQVPVPPLSSLKPAVKQTRNPRVPFPQGAMTAQKKKPWKPTDPIGSSAISAGASAWGVVSASQWYGQQGQRSVGKPPPGQVRSRPFGIAGADVDSVPADEVQPTFFENLLDFTNWPMVLLLIASILILIPDWGRFGWLSLPLLATASITAYDSKLGKKVARLLTMGSVLVAVSGSLIIALITGLGPYSFWIEIPKWSARCSGLTLVIYLGVVTFYLLTGRRDEVE